MGFVEFLLICFGVFFVLFNLIICLFFGVFFVGFLGIVLIDKGIGLLMCFWYIWFLIWFWYVFLISIFKSFFVIVFDFLFKFGLSLGIFNCCGVFLFSCCCLFLRFFFDDGLNFDMFLIMIFNNFFNIVWIVFLMLDFDDFCIGCGIIFGRVKIMFCGVKFDIGFNLDFFVRLIFVLIIGGFDGLRLLVW